VSHVQHLRWYPHVRAWRHRVERVIKHTDYAEYVSEDPAVLPHPDGLRIEDGQCSMGETEEVDNSKATATEVAGMRQQRWPVAKWWRWSARLGFGARGL
jgi:hypothetical protein